jgi:hypothetical protein
MHLVNLVDDIGIYILLRPMHGLFDFNMLNLIDDMGIFFVCKPLWYIHRLAEIMVGADEIDRPISSCDSPKGSRKSVRAGK